MIETQREREVYLSQIRKEIKIINQINIFKPIERNKFKYFI